MPEEGEGNKRNKTHHLYCVNLIRARNKNKVTMVSQGASASLRIRICTLSRKNSVRTFLISNEKEVCRPFGNSVFVSAGSVGVFP